MNDCLAKPMDPEKLRQILKKYALCRELANLFVCVTGTLMANSFFG